MHWFSETPDVPDSRHWGNAFPRHVLWAVFYDAAVGRHILVANLHLDHLSRRMNRRALEQLPQVLRHEAENRRGEPLPIVVGGDFNEPAQGCARAPLSRAFTSVLALIRYAGDE